MPEDGLARTDARRATIMVVATEGSDTCMFWTMAPYLLNRFREISVPDQIGMHLLYMWASAGSAVGSSEDYDAHHYVHLKGLEYLNSSGTAHNVFILDKNPDHPSHKFAEMEAERIAPLIIEEFGLQIGSSESTTGT